MTSPHRAPSRPRPATAAGVVQSYLRHLRAHEVPLALALLADDCVFTDAAGSFEMGRSDIEQLLRWDAAVGAVVSCESMEAIGDDLRAVLLEQNEFLGLLGIRERRYRLDFRVDAGSIRRQVHAALPCAGPSDEEAMRPMLTWATRRAPEELERLVSDDGRMVMDEASAGRWLGLLRRWREDVGPS